MRGDRIDGTDFGAAEAADAALRCMVSFAVDHRDDICRTDLRTAITTDALALLEAGKRAQVAQEELSHGLWEPAGKKSDVEGIREHERTTDRSDIFRDSAFLIERSLFGNQERRNSI